MPTRSTLFLPGAAGRTSFFAPLASLLGVASPWLFGWPGFGDNPADPSLRSLDDLYAWLGARLPDGELDVLAQSMGGVLAVRLALDAPERVRRLVLFATSGGVDVARFGALDWRASFRAANPSVPPWFERDRTDLDARLGGVRAPTLLVWGDADPISPVAIGEHLRTRIPRASLVVVPGGTHALAEERAAEIAPRVAEHLAS